MSESNGLPKGWAEARIDEFATTATGGTPSRRNSRYFGGTIPWVKSGELGDGRVYQSEETLTDVGLQESNAKLFPAGTLCIALYGATVGKLGVLEVEATTNQAVCGIFLPPEVLRSYLFHFLLSIRSRLVEQGKGGAQPNISNGLVRETVVRISPLPEQHRIVDKIDELFSDLDAGVSALQRAKANLKRYRASVLKSAVEGRLTVEWRKEHPQSEDGGMLLDRILWERKEKWEKDQLLKFKEKGKEPTKGWGSKYEEPSAPDTSELPELPEGWVWASLHAVAFFQNGHAFPSKDYSDNGVRLLRPGNLFDDGTVRWTDKNTRCLPKQWETDCPEYIVGEDEVVMNLTAQSLKDDFLGRACITGDGEKCLLNQRLARITPNSAISSRYLLFLLKSRLFRELVKGLNTGSLIQHMFTSQLKNFVFPLPPLAEQEQIVSLVDERLSQIDSAEKTIDAELIRAKRLRQSILKQAFEGKLVPQDPKDEPASVLLEQIKASKDTEQPKKKTKKVKVKSK